jgi:sensor histidine kinase YesM
VENAIKHGVARIPGPGLVLVHASASASANELQLTVEDNGPWLESNERGVGLANTRSRLLQLYGSRYRFVIEPASGNGSRVQITIPLEVHVEKSVA